MSEVAMDERDIEVQEDAAEMQQMFVEEFELAADSISEEIADIEEAALRAMHDETSVNIASEGKADDIEVAGSYNVVDLRGRFCPGASSWGNSGKGYGVIMHYNGPPAPARAWNNPVAWIKFLSDYHSRPGHFAPGWRINGIAYHEFILGNTVFRTRNYAADLPHCGNLAWNRNSLGLHIPIGGSQRPIQAKRGTLNTALQRADDHLRAMKKGRAALKGHQEVGSSNCPGPHIMTGIRNYRSGAPLDPSPEAPEEPKDKPGREHRMSRYEWCQDDSAPAPAILTYDGKDVWRVERVNSNPQKLPRMSRWEWCQDNSAPAPVVLTYDGGSAWKVTKI